MRAQADFCCAPYFERLENIILPESAIGGPMFFTFPEDARWSAEHQAVEFGVEIRVPRRCSLPRRVFQRILPERPTPERCVEAYYLSGPGSRSAVGI
jgi:hypothetical protein